MVQSVPTETVPVSHLNLGLARCTTVEMGTGRLLTLTTAMTTAGEIFKLGRILKQPMRITHPQSCLASTFMA